MLKKIKRKLGFEKYPADFDPAAIEIIETVRPYTMTTPERIFALVESVRYVVARGIAGSVVECGVWRGGSTMAAVLTLRSLRILERDVYLFDTYDGMPAPGDDDVDLSGVPAVRYYRDHRRPSGGSEWCAASFDEVQRNLYMTGYPKERIHLVKGKVQTTLPSAAPSSISLLRLDTDWYDSTRHELEHLFPRLQPGGVLIIDDYGHWRGSRKAADEYFRTIHPPILLSRVDYTGRVGIKA